MNVQMAGLQIMLIGDTPDEFELLHRMSVLGAGFKLEKVKKHHIKRDDGLIIDSYHLVYDKGE